MKTLKQFNLMALIAIFLIVMIACNGDKPCTYCDINDNNPCTYCGKPCAHDDGEWHLIKEHTTTEAGLKELRCTICEFVLDTEIIPMIKLHDLKLGDLDVTVEDKTGELDIAQVEFIQGVLNAFNNSTAPADRTAMILLNNRGVSLTIIIDKGDAYVNNYEVIDGRTFAMRYEFVSEASEAGLWVPTRAALRAVAQTPIIFGYLNTARNDNEKIPVRGARKDYEEQMATFLINLQQGYDDLTDMYKTVLAGKIKWIDMTTTSNYRYINKDADGIGIILGVDLTSNQIMDTFVLWIDRGDFAP